MKAPLLMTAARTVLGHALKVGQPLTVVKEPTAAGEVDSALAKRLRASGLAAPVDQIRPTPVESTNQQAVRLIGEAELAGESVADETAAVLIPQDDLVTWQTDDAAAGRAAGDRVTNDDLRLIAEREGSPVETDDNKVDLQRKIMEHRAAQAAVDTV